MSMQRPDVGRTGTTRVSFVCQKCFLPLRPDHSLANISAAQYDELTAPFTSSSDREDLVKITPSDAGHIPDGDAKVDDSVFHKVVPPAEILPCDSGNDFTLLGVPSPHAGENISQVMKVTTELFDILSGQSEVDHPLCEECTDTLLDKLDHQLKITEDECKDYKSFLEKLTEAEDEVDDGALDEELSELKDEENELMKQLEAIEEEGQQLDQQLLAEKERSQQLEQEEDRYFKEYNEYKRQLLEYEDAQRSVDNQLRYAKSQLDCLKKTNVFNATFHIWHRGHFGTINNFRLGRLPSVPVEWSEINAAWGQTVLLLHSLANKMNLQFERYRLVPYGNHSFLESLKDKSKELPLYGSGGFRFFWDAKFDQAMVAFLDCLQQFKEEVEKGDPDFCLPYRMEKGRIEDASTGTSYSVKIQFNSEEQWTKALKFMLTNLKWGLAWVSSQFANK